MVKVLENSKCDLGPVETKSGEDRVLRFGSAYGYGGPIVAIDEAVEDVGLVGSPRATKTNDGLVWSLRLRFRR